MNTLILNTGEYKINELLSSNFPFCVYKATDKSGKTIVRPGSVTDFTSFVGKQTKGAADEQIVFETIKVDGPMAFVWTPYRFVYNGKYSHSGVNVFCLVKFGDQWKIQYLIDTRRK
jgi:hypothetical protein